MTMNPMHLTSSISSYFWFIDIRLQLIRNFAEFIWCISKFSESVYENHSLWIQWTPKIRFVIVFLLLIRTFVEMLSVSRS